VERSKEKDRMEYIGQIKKDVKTEEEEKSYVGMKRRAENRIN
jgi:hypothetical protein